MCLFFIISILGTLVLIFMSKVRVDFDEGVYMFQPKSSAHVEYRHLTLPNRMEVIVGSDPRSTMAGAAVSVGVGSYSEPREIQGLAHLTEHMLFLGSSKYPERDEFNRLVTEGGGDYNAYTTG